MLRSSCLVLCTVIAALLCASEAHAQAVRTWTSGTGDDANPCSRTAPCHTFAGAISKTLAGGEIDALDPGAFGTLTITKAITVDGGAGLAGILASGTSGVTINAGAGDVVILRNLSILGASGAINAVNILNAKAVHIEDTVISNFQTAGISVAQSSNPVALYVKNVSIRNCAVGLQVGTGDPTQPLPASLVASVWNSVFANSPAGIYINGGSGAGGTGSQLALYNSVLSGHSTAGLHTVGSAQVSMERGAVVNSTIGINAEAGSVRLSEVMLSQNITGLASTSGTITSFGNNALAAGNQANGSVTNTIPLQ